MHPDTQIHYWEHNFSGMDKWPTYTHCLLKWCREFSQAQLIKTAPQKCLQVSVGMMDSLEIHFHEHLIASLQGQPGSLPMEKFFLSKTNKLQWLAEKILF